MPLNFVMEGVVILHRRAHSPSDLSPATRTSVWRLQRRLRRLLLANSLNHLSRPSRLRLNSGECRDDAASKDLAAFSPWCDAHSED